jgi:glycosyltransferase involved in cell wall biosynthesis
VKNHEFLICACCELKEAGLRFRCAIAGGGVEHERLQSLIYEAHLDNQVKLLGHVPRAQLPELYSDAHVVVLTSHSEGIPQTLMEAMAMERVVLAPAITGIPELISDRKTGFLYQQNSLPDFLEKLVSIAAAKPSLDDIQRRARQHIQSNFNRQRNLQIWADDFIRHLEATSQKRETCHANPVLQQVQLPVQRDRSIPV